MVFEQHWFIKTHAEISDSGFYWGAQVAQVLLDAIGGPLWGNNEWNMNDIYTSKGQSLTSINSEIFRVQWWRARFTQKKKPMLKHDSKMSHVRKDCRIEKRRRKFLNYCIMLLTDLPTGCCVTLGFLFFANDERAAQLLLQTVGWGV